MDERLRQNIAETCGAEFWEPITGKLWQNEQPWDLWAFNQDVEFDGETWRCVIVQKIWYDDERPEEVEYAEDVLAEAWKL